MQIRIKQPQYEAAEAEAKRRRLATGNDVTWSDVVHECLEKHLPKGS